jgi:phenylalanyl-tRNA synthetase beta chain
MKVSLSWVKQFVDFELPPIDELTQKIGAQLGAIEHTDSLSEKYGGIVVARVVSIVDHPNADRLHICMINDGGRAQNVTRDEQGYVQVVCGAPNVREGIVVAWLPPGAVVPETYGKEPFTLEARDFRGIMSNGMLASARELGLGTDHAGIVELDPHEAQPGADFAETYQLNDEIIDIENKMFTHRPDCFGELGVAREIAGILGHAFTSPEWYKTPCFDLLEKSNDNLPLEVRNELPTLVPRFMAVPMHIRYLGSSPIWLQTYLSRVGLRPVSNVVDITNYMMLLTGQPLHAYDYDKVKAQSSGELATLVVRYPKQDEKLRLLNGKEITPRDEAILIATDQQAIGLGGVMGGADTEIDEHTRTIILECATFDMYSIRRTSMTNGLFTDAVTRFNKGQSPLQNDRVLGEAMRLLGELAGATLAGDICDVSEVNGRVWVHPPVPVTVTYINERLGIALSAEDMKRLLENVEFCVSIEDELLTVTAPFWRTDIELREDVVEEVGRLYGFDHVPLTLPIRAIAPVKKDEFLELKSRVREILVKNGANEVLTYSFVHGNLLDRVSQDKTQALKLSNAISPELQFYRLSLTPSLLDKIHLNSKAGHEQFALFEIGLVHHKQSFDPIDISLPLEDMHVTLVFAASSKASSVYGGAAYYEARTYLSTLLPKVDLQLVALKDWDFKDDVWGVQMCAPYETSRSAVIVRDDLVWGVVGEFKQSVAKNLKLPTYTAGFEFGLELLRNAPSQGYTPLPRFPKVEQDICLKVTNEVTYRAIYDLVSHAIADMKPEQTITELSPVDIYQRADDQQYKQITLRLSIASYVRTLTDEEIAKLLDHVALQAAEKLGAERI